MSTTVQIGGEPVVLQEFMAFKALTAMRLVADVEAAFREVMKTGAEFKRQYEAENVVTMPRAEARRLMGPSPLVTVTRTQLPDGRVEVREEPVVVDGVPVLGPDQLEHLTEEDWAASGHVLVMPDSPSKEMTLGVMIPKGFAMAREQVLRILALVLTSNRDLEAWDTPGEDIDARLDAAAKALMHEAKLHELIRLGVAAMNVCREQVADPFAEAKLAWEALRPPEPPATQNTPAPATVELPTDGKPTSSTSSPADSGGTPAPPSTEPDGG